MTSRKVPFFIEPVHTKFLLIEHRIQMDEDMVQLGKAAVKKHWEDWFKACDQGFQPTHILKDLVRIVALYVWSAGELFMISVREPLIRLDVRRAILNINEHLGGIKYVHQENELDALETRICARFPLPTTTPTLQTLMSAISHGVTDFLALFPSNIAWVDPTEFQFESRLLWQYYIRKTIVSTTPYNLQLHWRKIVADSFTRYFLSLLRHTPLSLHDF